MLQPNVPVPNQPVAQIRLLGQVAVASSTGTTTVNGRPALILASLALQVGPISTQRLIDLLWDEPPANPANALQRHISRIRAVLARHGVEGAIHRSGGTYELVRGAISVDIDELETDASGSRCPVRWWLEPLAGINHIDFDGHRWRLQQLCDRARQTSERKVAAPGPSREVPPEVIHELNRWLDLRATHDETAGVIRAWLESVTRPAMAENCQA